LLLVADKYQDVLLETGGFEKLFAFLSKIPGKPHYDSCRAGRFIKLSIFITDFLKRKEKKKKKIKYF
jgi:hypothetical protein